MWITFNSFSVEISAKDNWICFLSSFFTLHTIPRNNILQYKDYLKLASWKINSREIPNPPSSFFRHFDMYIHITLQLKMDIHIVFPSLVWNNLTNKTILQTEREKKPLKKNNKLTSKRLPDKTSVFCLSSNNITYKKNN